MIILLFIVLSVVVIFMNMGRSDMKIYFFKAGKADSALIYNSKFSVLIDTGEEKLADDIIEYLNENNIDSIDYLIITHFDKDHVGSAHTIIDKFRVDHVIHSNYPKDTEVYNKYIESLNNKGLDPLVLYTEMSIDLDDIKITINPPKVEEYSKDPSNNSSLIVDVKFKNTSFLFMGDAEDLRIEEYLSDHTDKVDFLKVPYHGHYQDSLEKLISTIMPKYSVITCSDKKKEDEETLTVLAKYNSKYYLTRNGSILVTSDGDSINVKQ